MKKLIAGAVLMLALANCQTAQEEKNKQLVLPNPKLLRCMSAECFQLWLETPIEPGAIFPKQLSVDMNQNCLYGLKTTYDKSVPFEEVKAAIDEHYGKWAFPDNNDVTVPVKLWRVQSEKFVIQLAVANKKDEKMNFVEAGTKQLIYIAIGATKACNNP